MYKIYFTTDLFPFFICTPQFSKIMLSCRFRMKSNCYIWQIYGSKLMLPISEIPPEALTEEARVKALAVLQGLAAPMVNKPRTLKGQPPQAEQAKEQEEKSEKKPLPYHRKIVKTPSEKPVTEK